MNLYDVRIYNQEGGITVADVTWATCVPGRWVGVVVMELCMKQEEDPETFAGDIIVQPSDFKPKDLGKAQMRVFLGDPPDMPAPDPKDFDLPGYGGAAGPDGRPVEGQLRYEPLKTCLICEGDLGPSGYCTNNSAHTQSYGW